MGAELLKREGDAERLERLRDIVSRLPDKPGCYQYFDKAGTIIYVGKAKNLKNRVASYFRAGVDSYKTRMLVSKIFDLKYVVVRTEEDALLLENNLIKRFKPRYNILLKDDKTYPSICVTDEEFPRVFKTRRPGAVKGTFFGPYSHLGSMYAALDVIKKVFHPRSCRLPLTREKIEQGCFKACLEYHIGNCMGPCVARQSRDDYQKAIAGAKEILKGNTRLIERRLFDIMTGQADALLFEDAERTKKKYLLMKNYVEKSEVVSHSLTDLDVFSVADDKTAVFVNYLHVVNGAVNQAFTYEYKKKLDETPAEALSLAIVDIRSRWKSESKEIIVPFEPDTPMEGLIFTIPLRGDKKKLLDLSLMNGRQYRFDRLKQAEKLNPEQRQVRMMKKIQETLHLKNMPCHIEMFDNSNISGSDAVAACVVFKMLRPSRKDYRRYNIKTVTGPDDYASMKEVTRRRYSRLKEEGSPLPDLIIADGGKGQMEMIREVVEDELSLEIPIAGLSKDSRHRTSELLFGFPTVTVGMKTDSELFLLLTRMQDEAHRFAITFHRDKRSKRALASELDDIRGIGPKTRDRLLKALKSVRHIREADLDALTSIVGASKAAIIQNHFHTIREQ